MFLCGSFFNHNSSHRKHSMNSYPKAMCLMFLCGSNNEGGTIRKVRNKKNPSVKRMDPNLYRSLRFVIP